MGEGMVLVLVLCRPMTTDYTRARLLWGQTEGEEPQVGNRLPLEGWRRDPFSMTLRGGWM